MIRIALNNQANFRQTMTIVAVFNQKGGVGKTTTVLNLAAALARRDRKPVGVDLDF